MKRLYIYLASFIAWLGVGLWDYFYSPGPVAESWVWIILFGVVVLLSSMNLFFAARTARDFPPQSDAGEIARSYVRRESVRVVIGLAMMFVGIAVVTLWKVLVTFMTPAFFAVAFALLPSTIDDWVERLRRRASIRDRIYHGPDEIVD